MGHSGLTGEGTGGPSQPVPDNSWATGSNPEVNSIYWRLHAARPELAGTASNQAHGGANADELRGMTEAALGEVPRPALAIIQTIDNDIHCDGSDAVHVAEVGASVKEALDAIRAASPETRILLVGQAGRPSVPFVKLLIAHDPSVVPSLTGSGMCDFLDADGQPVTAHFATLTKIIDAYEAEVARVCAAVPHCVTDGGLRAKYVDVLENFSPDWSHFNVRGQAAQAKLIWPVVEKLLGL